MSKKGEVQSCKVIVSRLTFSKLSSSFTSTSIEYFRDVVVLLTPEKATRSTYQVTYTLVTLILRAFTYRVEV
jgi:hypothetical protein